jgi:hypothetical protein
MGRTEREFAALGRREGLSSVAALSRDCRDVGRGPMGWLPCLHRCGMSWLTCTRASAAMSRWFAQRPSVP